MTKKKIVIICGGVAGLSAGIYAAMNGFDTEITLAGRVSHNKRKILLKTLEQLAFACIEFYFLAIDNLIFMSSCIEFTIPTLITKDFQSHFKLYPVEI